MSTSHLCIDIGNSRCKYAVFTGREMVEYITSKNPGVRTIRSLYKKYTWSATMISSTRNVDTEWLAKIRKISPVHVLDHQTSIPIKNHYATPETLGKDRLAGIIAAHALYPDKACMVADLGTCNTYDIIDAEGNYWGGMISPGWKMRLMAMHRFTDRLPLVVQSINKTILGDSTVKALQNGAFYGAKGEIESFIDRMKENYDDIAVIFTGGDAEEFAKLIESKIFVHPFLVLEGLNEILQQYAA